MKIRVDRDSVCMGDDVLPHETEFEIPEDMTVFCMTRNAGK